MIMTNQKSTSYALVTGATSGIGYELAKLAAKDGYNLVLVARDQQELDKVKTEFQNQNINVITIAKNLFEINAASEVYHQTKELGIHVDILINDAGQGRAWEIYRG